MSGAPLVVLVAALGWGAASLILSPCHLASIPLIVGFIGDRGRTAPRQALVLALLFALGILGAIAAVGGVTAVAGRMLGDVGPWANYAVAAVLVIVGLHLLGVLPLTFGSRPTLPRYRGKMAALLLGLVFGLALGPCTFAYLAPVLESSSAWREATPGMRFSSWWPTVSGTAWSSCWRASRPVRCSACCTGTRHRAAPCG